MNFYIGVHNHVIETIKYLEYFIRYLPNKDLSDKTFRLLFDISDGNNVRNYAYIIDRKYFSIANINQIRYVSGHEYCPGYMEVFYELENFIVKYLPDCEAYTCRYNSKTSLNYKWEEEINTKLLNLNEADKLNNNSIIILIEMENRDDIYYSNDYVIQIMGKNKSDSKYINYINLLLALTLYASKCDIITNNGNDTYIKVWDDKLFCKYYNKEFFNKIYEKSDDKKNKKILKQFIYNKVEVTNLVTFILSYCYPINVIKKEHLHKILLPNNR